MARLSNPRLGGDVGLLPAETSSVGFCGDFTPGAAIGASSSRPWRSACSRNGPNSSPIQKVPVAVDCDRLRVEVEAGEQPGGRVGAAGGGRRGRQHVERERRQVGADCRVAHDLPGHALVGVAEHDGLEHAAERSVTEARSIR